MEASASGPSIAVVTPSLNQAAFLEETIRSVLDQGYPALEYFVVDGGSTDGTLEILRAYEDRLTGWISEPDDGQADAIAKGFARTSGAVLNWLNADDLLLDGALEAVGRAFRETGADLVVGRDRHFRDHPSKPVSVFEPAGYAYPDCVRFWNGAFRYHQPCTFFSRAFYERVGGLDRGLRYAMDYDLYCRLLREEGARVTYLAAELSAFRLHEGAKTARAKPGFLDELTRSSRRYWTDAERDDPSIERQLRRYVSECVVHQAAEAVRRRSLRGLLASLRGLGRGDRVHAARYAASRIFAKAAPERGRR